MMLVAPGCQPAGGPLFASFPRGGGLGEVETLRLSAARLERHREDLLTQLKVLGVAYPSLQRLVALALIA